MVKNIEVKDQKVTDIVTGIANHFNLECEINKNEYCVQIPKKIGSGYIKATQFKNGIGVVESNYLLEKPFRFKVKKGVLNPLKFIFNREATILHKFSKKEVNIEIKSLEHLMVASNPTNIHEFTIPAKQPIFVFNLEINRKIFEQRIKDYLPDMNKDLVQIFRDVNGIIEFMHKSQYSLEISRLINEFTTCDLEGFMRSVFLESKIKEILILQLQQYLDEISSPEKKKILRQSTIQGVKEAVKIIENDTANIDGVIKLAKRVNLSPNTLQQGFQLLLKSSVNDYVKHYKIDKAKELIETTELNITQISYKIGINSRSYFSKLFKIRYGLTPKQYYLKARLNHSKNSTKI